MQPVRIRLRLTTRADIHEAWRVVCDTDRFNRAAGLGFRLAEEPREDGSVRRLGEVRKLGLTVRWEERPVRYVQPEWLCIERVFSAGPVKRLVLHIHLEAIQEGTAIRYEMDLEPTSLFTRPVVAFDVVTATRPLLAKTLRQAVALLDGDTEVDYDPPAWPLDTSRADRLDALCATLEPALGQRLAHHIRYAPLARQARMLPLLLAEQWGLPVEDVVRDLLKAVRRGLLMMRWELMCPSCLGPKRVVRTLWEDGREAHCPSCDLRYDSAFPDVVQVVFRPDPSIRPVEVPLDCLVSPGSTPHVLAKRTLNAGESVDWPLDLEEGSYRLVFERGVLGSTSIQVGEGLPTRLRVKVDGAGVSPAIAQLARGKAHLVLTNERMGSLRVSLERRWRPPFALTAARLLEVPQARALLPEWSLGPGIEVESGRMAVLAALPLRDRGGADGVVATLRRRDPRLLHVTDRAIVAVWGTFGPALEAAEEVAGTRAAVVALDMGPVTRLSRADIDMAGGAVVERALGVVCEGGAGRTLLSRQAAKQPEVRSRVLEWVDAGRAEVDLELPVTVHMLSFTATRRAAQMPRRAGPFSLVKVVPPGRLGPRYVGLAAGRDATVEIVDAVDDPGLAQRFYEMLYAAARVEHPVVAPVLGWGQLEDGRLWMAEARFTGTWLSDRLSGGVLPWDEVCSMASSVLEGLVVLHRAGLVHRDVCPRNLLLTPEGEVRLHGLSLVAPRDAVDGIVELDGPHVAPELRARVGVDHRSDLYALGAAMYEALVGRPPPRARPLSPSVFPDGMSDHARRTIVSALAHDPAERPQSATRMRELLGPAPST